MGVEERRKEDPRRAGWRERYWGGLMWTRVWGVGVFLWRREGGRSRGKEEGERLGDKVEEGWFLIGESIELAMGFGGGN